MRSRARPGGDLAVERRDARDAVRRSASRGVTRCCLVDSRDARLATDSLTEQPAAYRGADGGCVAGGRAGPMDLPELHLADWRPTKDTLHLYCQILGKVPARTNGPPPQQPQQLQAGRARA